MVSLMVILFSTKCFLFVYMYIDLSKRKAYKVFETSDANLPWLLFYRSQLVEIKCHYTSPYSIKKIIAEKSVCNLSTNDSVFYDLCDTNVFRMDEPKIKFF